MTPNRERTYTAWIKRAHTVFAEEAAKMVAEGPRPRKPDERTWWKLRRNFEEVILASTRRDDLPVPEPEVE